MLANNIPKETNFQEESLDELYKDFDLAFMKDIPEEVLFLNSNEFFDDNKNIVSSNLSEDLNKSKTLNSFSEDLQTVCIKSNSNTVCY